MNNVSQTNLGALRYLGGGALALTNGNMPNERPGLWKNWIMQSGATTALRTAAHPTGYYPDNGGWRMPIVAGEISFAPSGAGAITVNLFPGRLMTLAASGSGGLSADLGLIVSMIVSMTGSGAMTTAISGLINAQVGMSGSGGLAAAANGLAAMSAALSGSGSLAAAIAAIGNMNVDIIVTGTGLTTANVGPAVWGTGIEGGYDAKALMKLIAAMAAGKLSGAPAGPILITGVDGTTTRITATVDTDGNRLTVTYDVS